MLSTQEDKINPVALFYMALLGSEQGKVQEAHRELADGLLSTALVHLVKEQTRDHFPTQGNTGF